MKVREIMRHAPISVASDDDVALVAERMAWAGIHHMPVVRQGKLLGLVSELDVAVHLSRHGSWGATQPATQIMRAEPPTAGPEDDVPATAERMVTEDTDCLPVVDDGRLVGIVTTTDLLLAVVEEAKSAVAHGQPARSPALVSDAMTEGPATARATDGLLDAAARMRTLGVRHLPVVDAGDRLIGVLSEADVRAKIGDPVPALASPEARAAAQLLSVEAAMVHAPLSTTPDRPVREVARTFINRAVTALPVVNAGGAVVGMLSYVDLLRVLTRS